MLKEERRGAGKSSPDTHIFTRVHRSAPTCPNMGKWKVYVRSAEDGQREKTQGAKEMKIVQDGNKGFSIQARQSEL